MIVMTRAVHSLVKKTRGDETVEDKELKKLKKILLSIATANADEVLRWGKARLDGGGDEIKLSRALSSAVSSMKLKSNGDALEIELKLCDKLKAIELYLRLIGAEGDASDGTLYIDYDYKTPRGLENED